MASKVKLSECEDDDKVVKHLKKHNEVDSEHQLLDTFLKWCEQIGIEIDFQKVFLT